MLVSGSGDRTIRLWQLDSGACVATLEGHGDAVTCLTLAGESGKILVNVIDDDKSIKHTDF